MSSLKRKRGHELRQAGEYSDLTIRLRGGEELKCHRVIVCTGCEFFANAVKDGTFKESNTGIIEMMNDPPAAVKKLIDFLYTEEYHGSHSRDGIYFSHGIEDAPTSPLAHAEVYAVASIYRVRELETIAASMLLGAILNQKQKVLEVFPQVVKIVYESVPESRLSLHDQLVEFASANLEVASPENICLEMMQEAPEFMAKVFQKTRAKMEEMSQKIDQLDRHIKYTEASRKQKSYYKCPQCRERFTMKLPGSGIMVGCPNCQTTRTNDSWLHHLVAVR